MEGATRKLIPRSERRAGYGGRNQKAHTPGRTASGVWEPQPGSSYPGKNGERGMGVATRKLIPRSERQAGYGGAIRKLIPRSERRAGYGSRNQEAHTPERTASGVWRAQTGSSYPGKNGERGMRVVNQRRIPAQESGQAEKGHDRQQERFPGKRVRQRSKMIHKWS